MNLRSAISILALMLALSAQAQDKVFAYDDMLNWQLYPKSIQNLAWRGSMDVFTKTDGSFLLQTPADNPAQTDTLLSLEQLKQKAGGVLDKNRRFPSITWLDENRFYFINEQKIMLYDFAKDTLTVANEFPEEAETIEIHQPTLNAAYTVKNKLFVAVAGKITVVVDEPNVDILYGHVPSRNEFGINNGAYWSPDGKKLAFYRINQSEVAKYPLVDLYQRMAKEDMISYPMAGEKSQKVKLGIFDLDLNEVTYLQTAGSENQYITSVTWAPQGEFIYAALLNRDQNYMVMNRYETKTGALANRLFEEENPKYVEPLNPLTFLPTSQDQFIWQSRRDGWNHLYLYNTQGRLLKQITKGEWEVTALVGFDTGENHVYFQSTQESPLERHLYKTDINKGKAEKLTSDAGTHYIIPSENKNYFLSRFSSTSLARGYYLINDKGEKLHTLLEDENPWKDYKTGEMEIFTLKADDGTTDLYCRLIKPVDFDPSKKYPAIVYVYGGPHAQMITNSWTGGAGFWLNILAQQGYVVFTLDNRGSAYRGYAFESIIHRQCGEVEMADQMTGVEYLQSLDYVDAENIGVDGWSYGGFMVTSLMLRQPGTFKAACAGGPVIDWKWYEAMYGERYMDTPMQNPEGYQKASLLNYVENLEGNLLLIHGTNDPVVMWQNSLIFLDECINQGKQVDYFVYPGAGHNTRGKARVHMVEKIAGFFDLHLK
jgi:dipeptidyl-peptidase 4